MFVFYRNDINDMQSVKQVRSLPFMHNQTIVHKELNEATFLTKMGKLKFNHAVSGSEMSEI